uniref:Uncharacterized protein n=1 Tax=Tolypothrix bouteillei VB521301 TaxID=1479485 RepID=A0A0C1N774_9CYAN
MVYLFVRGRKLGRAIFRDRVEAEPQSVHSQAEPPDRDGRCLGNTCRLSLKMRKHVGWVEERNPTFTGICWVCPTYKNSRALAVLGVWELFKRLRAAAKICLSGQELVIAIKMRRAFTVIRSCE